jgi:hypothetical protein
VTSRLGTGKSLNFFYSAPIINKGRPEWSVFIISWCPSLSLFDGYGHLMKQNENIAPKCYNKHVIQIAKATKVGELSNVQVHRISRIPQVYTQQRMQPDMILIISYVSTMDFLLHTKYHRVNTCNRYFSLSFQMRGRFLRQKKDFWTKKKHLRIHFK